MPKIFGKVAIDVGSRTALCTACGFRWKASNEELREYKLGHKITCPVCRVTKEYPIGTPIEGAFIIANSVLSESVINLSSSRYQDYELTLKSLSCGHTFKVKSRDLDQFLAVGKCPICNPNLKYSLEKRSQTPPLKASVQKIDGKPITSVNKAKGEPEKAKIMIKEANKSEPNNQDSTDKESPETLKKVGNVLRKYIGNPDPIYGIYIDEVDDVNGECTIRCFECGLVRHVGFASFSSGRRTELYCPRCEKNKKSGRKTIDNLTSLYCGKIYNGLRITKIYKEKSKILCDLECLSADISVRDKHNITGALLSDVVGRKVYCQKCGDNPISSSRRLLNNVECWRMRNNLSQGRIESRVVGNNPDVITGKDVYCSNGKICDKCRHASTCPDKDNISNRYSYIREMADFKDSFKIVGKDVAAQYPMIYGSFENGASTLETNIQKGLVIFRDAYRGRDGQLYTFCKCASHGTEMLLSESEIADFDHSKFCVNPARFSRFYNIDAKYLLKKKQEKGK